MLSLRGSAWGRVSLTGLTFCFGSDQATGDHSDEN
jgi:hypothetical protein